MTNHFLQISIKKDSSLSGYTIALSPSLLHYWRINQKKPIYIRIGISKLPVLIQELPLEKQDISFSEDLFAAFKIPKQNISFLAQFSKHTQTISLGPIIAILTEIKDNNGSPNFRSIHQLCEELTEEISLIGGLLYVCGFQDFSTDSINGYFYHQDKWEKVELPYPNVIYNRIHSRKLDSSKHFQELKKVLKEKEIPLFNSQFFSKYETHLLLEKNTLLHKHTPETELLSNETTLRMLAKYPSIYIKPVHGSQGRHIHHIRKIDNTYNAISSSGKQKGKNYYFLSIEKLLKWIQRFTKNKTYLIQQGIAFQPFQQRSLDFRVLCHKNFYNQWKVTSVVARAAQKDSFVSNLAQGAEILQAKVVLNELFGKEKSQQLLAELKNLALDVATVITENTDGYLGEMGIDIGIDTTGELWIIEANSKPSKNLDDQSAKIRPSTKALLEYFIRLSFPHKDKGDN
ncbi:MAG: YheC/YheD family protein [Bacillus sp. (in: firmicutes)]